jgi:hypothetical protein
MLAKAENASTPMGHAYAARVMEVRDVLFASSHAFFSWNFQSNEDVKDVR